VTTKKAYCLQPAIVDIDVQFLISEARLGVHWASGQRGPDRGAKLPPPHVRSLDPEWQQLKHHTEDQVHGQEKLLLSYVMPKFGMVAWRADIHLVYRF
jgi:hypothetical protein